MKQSETPSSASSYIGHVKNGVIILDAQVSLTDGQAVRVELLASEQESPVSGERGEQLKQLQTLFAQWDEEDKEMLEEDAEAFHKALEQNRGLSFRAVQLD